MKTLPVLPSFRLSHHRPRSFLLFLQRSPQCHRCRLQRTMVFLHDQSLLLRLQRTTVFHHGPNLPHRLPKTTRPAHRPLKGRLLCPLRRHNVLNLLPSPAQPDLVLPMPQVLETKINLLRVQVQVWHLLTERDQRRLHAFVDPELVAQEDRVVPLGPDRPLFRRPSTLAQVALGEAPFLILKA